MFVHMLSLVQVHYILQEIVMGGMVLETNMSEILTHIEAQNKLEKSEVSAHFTLDRFNFCSLLATSFYTVVLSTTIMSILLVWFSFTRLKYMYLVSLSCCKLVTCLNLVKAILG